MPLITGIVPAHRPAGRFSVLVDGREIAVLTLEAIERLRLAVGRPIDGLEERVELERLRLHAYDRALNMLAFRARSSCRTFIDTAYSVPSTSTGATSVA